MSATAEERAESQVQGHVWLLYATLHLGVGRLLSGRPLLAPISRSTTVLSRTPETEVIHPLPGDSAGQATSRPSALGSATCSGISG